MGIALKAAPVKHWARRRFHLAVNVVSAFFDIRADDTLLSKTGKVTATAARRTLYVVTDYWVAILLATMVAFMKYRGHDYWSIFLATWAYDFVAAVAFYLVQIKSGQDITLGEALRRSADIIHGENRIAGYLTFLLVSVKAIIWEGPEQIVIFFRLAGVTRIMVSLVALSLIQGLFGAWLYSTGYDGVAALVGS
ncbi:MAG: hypothetical protein WCA83_14470 [Azonexus sp.]